jgi:hypothetical protein
VKIPPWSYSSLTSFETCARRYYHLKVARDVADTKHESAVWGSAVHKHLEDRLRDGTRLPDSISSYESFVAPIARRPGELIVERQFCIGSNLQPTEWSSSNAWCRGIVDVGVVNGPKALLLDWKSGKRKLESDQLKLFAGLAFSHYPDLKIVFTGFVWLKDGKVDKQKFSREEAPLIWQEFIPRVRRLERAYEESNFPPKPSGLCRNYCPVPRSKCEFSGRT